MSKAGFSLILLAARMRSATWTLFEVKEIPAARAAATLAAAAPAMVVHQAWSPFTRRF